jgi:hypothetical protein
MFLLPILFKIMPTILEFYEILNPKAVAPMERAVYLHPY